MALTDYKIGEWNSPIVNEADRPKKSAEEMKAAFDSNSNQLRTALNALIDALANGEGGDITMPQLSEGIPAAKLSDQLRAVLEEALEGVRSDDIVAIRIGDVGQLEVTFDGVEWVPVAGSGEGGGTDIAALPVAEDIEPPDGFLMYDASLKLPRRALWDKIRSKLSTSFLSAEAYASEDPATVKRAAEAAKLEMPRMIGSASFDGTEDVGLGAIGAQPANLVLQNAVVEMSAWQDSTTYSEYPYRAAIAINGTTQANYAEVVYAPAEQSSGNYAGVADTYDGGVYIYAKALPSADITIPTIKVEAAGSGNVSGGGTGGNTGSSGGGSCDYPKLIARVITETDLDTIEIEGLNSTAAALSVRLYKTGAVTGNGINLAINGKQASSAAGTQTSESDAIPGVQMWIIRRGDDVIAHARMANQGLNNYAFKEFGNSTPIESIAVWSSYHITDATKYYTAGTIVEIYEGVYPNVK